MKIDFRKKELLSCETHKPAQIKEAQQMADSLYSRLGGYDEIAMFATTLVGQAQKDEVLSRFWANRGEDRIARECQLLIDYLVKETGGQMYYTGRDMALSHQGMGITEADWSRFIEIVTSVAGELGVGPTEGGEVMAFLSSLKADIVTT
jgi:hemoglobin